jgi:hypothetical protein
MEVWMPDVCDVAANRRVEAGDLLMLVQATLEEPDEAGAVVEVGAVTAKVLRAANGEIVALTRVTMGPPGVGQPRPPQCELQARAQDLAEWIIAQIRSHLDRLDAVPLAPALRDLVPLGRGRTV